MKVSTVLAALTARAFCLASATGQESETKIALRECLQRAWTNELLTYPFSARKGECLPESVTLTGPQGRPVPVQLSDIEYWPNTKAVKSPKLSFIAGLAPLATDTHTVSYGNKPVPAAPLATDLTVTPGKDQVEITTKQFGARLLRGGKTYPAPVPAVTVAAPGDWILSKPEKGVKLTKTAAGWTLTVPAGVRTVRAVRGLRTAPAHGPK